MKVNGTVLDEVRHRVMRAFIRAAIGQVRDGNYHINSKQDAWDLVENGTGVPVWGGGYHTHEYGLLASRGDSLPETLPEALSLLARRDRRSRRALQLR